MKHFINIRFIIACLLCTLFVVACDKDDNDGVPVITGVRSVDAAKADSLFSDGERGQLIVLIGENLQGAKEIYINNQKISFNMTYVTSTHIILTIPAELVLVGEDSSLPAEIRLVTDYGIATYAFHVNCPRPYAVSYTTKWDGDNPIVPGQKVTIEGGNFYELERISLANINPYAEDEDGNPIIPDEPLVEYEITDYQVDDSLKVITLNMPEYNFEKGYFLIECYSGNAVLAFRAKRPKKPEIINVSSDMPILGETCTLYGKNFRDPVAVILGKDEITISDKELKVNDNFDELSFILSELPEVGETLVLVTEEGRDTIPFYQTSHIVADFDNSGAFWWGGYTDIGAIAVNNTTAQNPPAYSSGVYWGIEGTTIPTDWWGPLFYGDIRVVENISDGTPLENVEFRFECYMAYPWEEGSSCQLKYPDGDAAYFAPAFVDHLSGKVELGRWMTCAIPLNSYRPEATYGELLPSLKAKTEMFMHVCNEEMTQKVGFYVDNLRLYVNKGQNDKK